MPLPIRATAVALAASICGPVLAASGSILGFTSNATRVTVGQLVDFEVIYAVDTVSWSGGGSNPVPPPPQDGDQDWQVNWGSWHHETLTRVSLLAGTQSFVDHPSLPAGSSVVGRWNFSLAFDRPGTHQVDLSGSWDVEVSSGYSGESATRYCYFLDPDQSPDLWCSWWTWQYDDYDDLYDDGGTFGPAGITIDVVAGVPEPATLAMALGGVLWTVGAAARRRR